MTLRGAGVGPSGLVALAVDPEKIDVKLMLLLI